MTRTRYSMTTAISGHRVSRLEATVTSYRRQDIHMGPRGCHLPREIPIGPVPVLPVATGFLCCPSCCCVHTASRLCRFCVHTYRAVYCTFPINYPRYHKTSGRRGPANIFACISVHENCCTHELVRAEDQTPGRSNFSLQSRFNESRKRGNS